MSPRRVLALLFIVAGTILCGSAALHFVRGFEAQAAGRHAFEAWRAARPASPAPSPESAENVSVPSVSEPSECAAADVPPPPKPYPFGQPVARLCIPSAHIDAIVFGGSEPDILENGPGHVPGTELPGQESGWNNCVITAHRDSHFRNLGRLREGQRIELETPGGEENYRVVSREIVEPSARRVLMPTAKKRLTLITCYPFHFIGAAPQRFVVVAEAVTD